MASTNPFLAALEKDIALAIEADADSRGKKQKTDSPDHRAAQERAYSVDELAELIYYSAESAAQVFKQDLTRQQSRLSLGLNPTPTTPATPIDCADLLTQITAVIQFHNWLPASNQNLRAAFDPDSQAVKYPTTTQILINHLYQEETRSFQLHNQLTQDKLLQVRRGHLKENFTAFYTQLPTELKNQLIAEIPPEIILHNSTGQGQTSLLNWITRGTIKERALRFENAPTIPSTQAFSELLAERAQAAKQLKNAAKLLPGPQLEQNRQSTLLLIEEATKPGAFPGSTDVATATIEKLAALLTGFPFPLEALQGALAKTASEKTAETAEGKNWALQHAELNHRFQRLPLAQQSEIINTTGSLQPALAAALAAACKKSPRQKATLFHLSSRLTTGEMPFQSTLESINVLLIAARQLHAERQSLELKTDPKLKDLAQAAFNNTDSTGLDPATFSALRRFKTEGDELVVKLQTITATRTRIVFANTESPLAARLERAVGLTQLHPVLRQGITDTEITNEIISLLKERQHPFPTSEQLSQHLHIARLVDKIGPEQHHRSLHPLQKAALEANEKQPSIFHRELQDSIHSTIGQSNQTNIRQTFALAAELLRYLPLQPPLDPITVDITAQKLISEILRHAKSHQNTDLEKQFTNPSLNDMRVITYQAQKEVERKLTDRIARTVRKNTMMLEQQTVALAECFRSPLQLAKAWTRKESAETHLGQLRQTRATELATGIESLKTALSITEQAKELQTIEQFKIWIKDTHHRALESAQRDFQSDPFNITLRTRVQELARFKPDIETATTGVKDPAANLDMRAVWEMLGQNKSNIEHQIRQLQNEQQELQRVTTGIANAQSLDPAHAHQPNGKSRPQTMRPGINSLSYAFDAAFKNIDLQSNPVQGQEQRWINPFQGHPLETILEAGTRQLQLRAKTRELQQYWITLSGLPDDSPASINEMDPKDPAPQIEAAAKLLLFHEIAKYPAKPDLPPELNEIWRQQCEIKTPKPHSRPEPAKVDKSPVNVGI